MTTGSRTRKPRPNAYVYLPLLFCSPFPISFQALTRVQNIDKAKKEIERLEAEEAAEKSNGVNGDKADDKVAAVTEDVKEASLEEKKE